MANSRSDAVLVIRARDEAQKTIDAVSGALQSLLVVQNKVAGSAEQTGSNIAELASVLTTLDKAYSKISGSADSAAAAFERQQRSIADQRQQLSALQQQAEAAARVLARLNSDTAIVDAGRDQSARLAQVKQVTVEYERLQNQIGRLATTIATQEAALNASASSLQRVGSQANAVEAAVASARAEIDRETKALAAQTAAAERNAAVMANVNRVTGVTRDNAGADLAEQLRAEAAAREANIQKMREQERAAAELEAAQLAQQRAANFLVGSQSSGKSARESAAVFTEADNAANKRFAETVAQARREAAELDDTVARLRDELNPVAAIERNLAAEQAKLNAAFKAGKISAQELAGGMKLLEANAKAAAKAPKISLFGLKPYETQNLLFQFNDIATQLASGTSLSQTLAQQGGQILQLFPRVGSAIAAGLTSAPVLAFTAALAGVVLGIKEVNDQAERLRGFQGILDSMGEGAKASAQQLADAAKQIDKFGLSADDAVKIVRTFIKEGINPERLVAFGEAAKNMADVLGIDVGDAAKQLAEAFNGTYEGIKRLDDSTNLLTATERERIRTLFDQGRAQDAMRLAFEAMSGRLEKGAQDMRGPWSEATKALANAWQGFLETLSQSSIVQGMAEGMTNLANSVAGLLNTLSGNRSIRDIDNEINALYKDIGRLNGTFKLGGDPLGLKQWQIDKDVAKIKELIAERQKLVEQQKSLDANGGTGGTGTGTVGTGDVSNNAELKKQSDETLKDMSLERQLQTLREKGTKAVQNLRVRNEGFLTDAEKRRREALAGELAATKAIGDERVKQAAREKAVDEERQKIQQEQDSFNTAANTPQMTARQFIIGREGFRSRAYWDVNHFRVGFGSDTVTSPTGAVSTVTKDTTVDLAGAVRDLDRRIGEFQDAIKTSIGSDRFNSFSSEQQAALTSVAYNYGKLPESIIDAVRHGTGAEIAEAIRGLGNDNGGVNRGRRNLEASTFDRSNVALDANNAKQAEEQAAAQQKFNTQVDAGNEKLNQRTKLLEEQSHLTGQALLDAKARAAADEAELALVEKVKAENEQRAAQHKELITLSKEQIKATRDAAAAAVNTPQAQAQVRANEVDQNVQNLEQQRAALEQQQNAGVAGLSAQLADVTAKLNEARNAQIAFWEAVAAGGDSAAAVYGKTKEQIDAMVASMRGAQAQGNNLSTQFLATGRQINESFAQGAANAFDRFAQSVAQGTNVMKSLKEAFLQFAADFLRQIAQMIIKQAIFNAIGGASGGGGGGLGGIISGGISGLFAHSGGVVGDASTYGPNTGMRMVNPAWFTNAVRYHNGGIAGLAANEVPAVLQQGEEVLTRDDPRHILNGGGNAQVKIVNTFDAADMLSQGLSTRAGEQAILNLVRSNPGAFKQAMGG